MAISKGYSKKELKDFKEKITAKKKEVFKDIMNSQDIADNMLENSNTSGVIYSSHLADGGADQEEIEKAYYWVQRENKFLQYLDRALEMIDAVFSKFLKRWWGVPYAVNNAYLYHMTNQIPLTKRLDLTKQKYYEKLRQQLSHLDNVTLTDSLISFMTP